MDVKPFQAYRYDKDTVGDIGSCIAPPYDVIDSSIQEDLYQSSEYNIVRAIRGKKHEDDNNVVNVYTRAAEFLDNLLQKKALRQDCQPGLYAYIQKFTIGSNAFCRTGIIALGKLTPFGKGVQPHEKTLEGPKADRLNLTRATQAQFGQIFMLYDDPEMTVQQITAQAATATPDIDFTDSDGVRHLLYVIDDAEMIRSFVTMMADKQTVIADGHHRYETALNYWNETQNPNAAWQMMTFVNMHDEGLVIQPTHRLLSDLPDFSVTALLRDLTTDFTVQKYPFANETEKADACELMFHQMKQSESEGKPIFGLYAADRAFYGLTLKDFNAMKTATGQMSTASRQLDVNVLHLLILEKHLGICDQKLAQQSHIQYIKDLGDAIDQSIARVDSKQAQAVFFVNPTRIDQVKAVAAAGEKMPQKSTFFYPKIFSGLTINRIQPAGNPTPNKRDQIMEQECSK